MVVPTIPLGGIYVDPKAAFDSVDRDALLQLGYPLIYLSSTQDC